MKTKQVQFHLQTYAVVVASAASVPIFGVVGGSSITQSPVCPLYIF